MNRMMKIAAAVLALVMVLMIMPATMAAEDVHVLDVTTDLEALSANAANAGKEIVVGDYFTVILGEKTKIDSSKKSFEDGYEAAQRLNFQHKTAANENGVILPAVKFTTSAAATVKIWWVEGGDDNRQMAILNEAGEEVVRTNETLAKNGLCISELKLEAAGTYFLGTPDGSNYLFKVEVSEEAAEVPTEPTVTEPAETEPAATEPAATEPAATEPAATEPAATEPAGDADKTGDMTFVVIFAMMASAVALVVLTQKKRAF